MDHAKADYFKSGFFAGLRHARTWLVAARVDSLHFLDFSPLDAWSWAQNAVSVAIYWNLLRPTFPTDELRKFAALRNRRERQWQRLHRTVHSEICLIHYWNGRGVSTVMRERLIRRQRQDGVRKAAP